MSDDPLVDYAPCNSAVDWAVAMGATRDYAPAMAKKSFNEGRGPSQRQLRVGEVIRRTLAHALSQGDVHDPDLNRMSITVSEVRTTPDLRIATVFVLPLGGGNKDEAIALLKKNKHELRRFVGKKTALKFTPDLRFLIDDTFDRMDATRAMFADEAVRRDLDKDPES